MNAGYKKPWFKKWWVIIIILILISALVIFLVAVFYVFNLAQKISRGEIDFQQLSGSNQVVPAKNLNTIDIVGRPFLGAETAPIVIVGFMDFECPYCKESYNEIIKAILNPNPEYKDKIKFVFRHFPLFGDHKNALFAAQATECAFEQGRFWEMADFIYKNQDQLSETTIKTGAIKINLDSLTFSKCLNSDAVLKKIEADLYYGVDLEVGATPVFFFNGNKYVGLLKQQTLEQAIGYLLKN